MLVYTPYNIEEHSARLLGDFWGRLGENHSGGVPTNVIWGTAELLAAAKPAKPVAAAKPMGVAKLLAAAKPLVAAKPPRAAKPRGAAKPLKAVKTLAAT